jgi:hypothetical protein
VLLLAALAAVSPPQAQAQATVRILRPVRVTSADWDKLPANKRRELTVRERNGRLLTVRLVEFE